jgi:hypothetical protein
MTSQMPPSSLSATCFCRFNRRRITAAAGGPDAAMSPFVRRHLAELEKNRSAPPVPVTQASRQRRFAIALRDIDALAALQEIRSEVRRSEVRWS